MDEDLLDGNSPERLREFRSQIQALRGSPGLEAALRERIGQAHGPVLSGCGKNLAESPEGCFFLIGPEEQFRLLEEYLARVEGPQRILRLYPYDFWLRGL